MNIQMNTSTFHTYNKLTKLPLGQIQARGWLQEQLQRSAQGMGGHLDLLEPDMIATPFINYSRLKRLPTTPPEIKELDPTFCAGWSSEISGTYWTGLVQLAFTSGDAELIDKAEKWIEGVLKHQEPDGYLGGYDEHTDRKADYNAWGSNWCYRAMLSFFEATGREDVLNAVYRGLLWFCENWSNHKTDYAGPTIIESMIVVYSYTQDQKLVDFCKHYLDWLEINSRWPNSVSILLSEKLPYNSMHVVAYGENVKHPALVYCATGDERLLQASIHGIDKALARIIQPTGAPSSCSEYLSPVGSSSETEYCNFSTFQQTYSWMSIITGEAKYGDLIEQILFNGAQGARKKDERAIAYFSAPNQMYATRNSSIYTKSDTEAYAPCFYVACCPAQSVRTVPEYIRGMCLADAKDNLYLLAYGPAVINSKNLSFEMNTHYPFREDIVLRIKRANGAALHLRVPEWCVKPVFKVNGKSVDTKAVPGGYHRLLHVFAEGDVVNITFPMPVKIEKVNDGASAAKYPLVLSRGPLVFSLHIDEKWTAYEGQPMTPLPDGWTWFEATPKDRDQTDFKEWPWQRSIDEQISTNEIAVTELPAMGYPWDNPWIKLSVPLFKSPFCYGPSAAKTYEAWDCPLDAQDDAIIHELVPYGCTNLRITFFPRARV